MFARTLCCLSGFVSRCCSSALNGEELVRDGGVSLLATLLARCMYVVQRSTPPTDPAAVIVTNIMRTFAGIVSTPISCLKLKSRQKYRYWYSLVSLSLSSFYLVFFHHTCGSCLPEFFPFLLKNGSTGFILCSLISSTLCCGSLNLLTSFLRRFEHI